MLARLLGRIVVLRQRDMGLRSLVGQLDGYGVVAFRLVRESGKWAEMTVLDCSSRLELKNHAFVLIRLTLPLSFPDNGAPFLPVRDNISAEHVLLDGFWIHKRIPDIGARSVYGNGSPGDEILVHM